MFILLSSPGHPGAFSEQDHAFSHPIPVLKASFFAPRRGLSQFAGREQSAFTEQGLGYTLCTNASGKLATFP
jgi:hypothetical protein